MEAKLSPESAAWRASVTAAEMVRDKTSTSKELAVCEAWVSFGVWLVVALTAGGGTSRISDGLVFFDLLARLGRSCTTAERFLGGITYKWNSQKRSIRQQEKIAKSTG